MAETTIAVGPNGADTQGTITTQNVVPAGAATANSSVSLITGGRDTLTIQVSGTYTGALSLQGTLDGTAWVTLGGAGLIMNMATSATAATIASASTGLFQVGITGMSIVRLTALAAVTGTANITLRAADGNALVALDAPIPAGLNNIGAVTPATGTAFILATAATTNSTVLKVGTGSLYELTISNTTAAPVYVKLYNKATGPTVGTDIPISTHLIPANADVTLEFGPIGKRFAAGIALATTAGIAATDVQAIGAGVQVSATYI